jgi:hypothetical protein
MKPVMVVYNSLGYTKGKGTEVFGCFLEVPFFRQITNQRAPFIGTAFMRSSKQVELAPC